jgi:hypothetical protein
MSSRLSAKCRYTAGGVTPTARDRAHRDGLVAAVGDERDRRLEDLARRRATQSWTR